jgi:CO/xanthine dehydrogenase FAD-binding subunit
MTRQASLERHAGAVAACPVLAQALRHVAHPVIRNRGTIGGTIAHADASAELPAVLLALRGGATAQSQDGAREISAEDLFEFHLTTSVRPDEIITGVRFPVLPARCGSAFAEVARRHGDYALVGVCALVELGPDDRIARARLTYSGIAPTPVDAGEAAARLAGEAPDDALFREAGELATSCVDVIDEEQASIAYRKRLVTALTRRALADASARAASSEEV